MTKQFTYSDKTFLNMTKKQLLNHIRMLEYNLKVTQENLDIQYKNITEFIKEKNL